MCENNDRYQSSNFIYLTKVSLRLKTNFFSSMNIYFNNKWISVDSFDGYIHITHDISCPGYSNEN